jgi:hypothetical protein
MCVDSFRILSRINDISYILESEANLLETPSDATLHVSIQQRQRGFQNVSWTFLGALRQGLTEIYFDIRNFVSQNVFVGVRAFNFRGGEPRQIGHENTHRLPTSRSSLMIIPMAKRKKKEVLMRVTIVKMTMMVLGR